MVAIHFTSHVKHFRIADLGFADAIKALEQCYKDGLLVLVSKDDFVAALRSHKLPSMQQKAHKGMQQHCLRLYILPMD